MMKINKNLIFLGLLFIVAVASSMLVPQKTYAQYEGFVNAYNSTTFRGVNSYNGGYNSGYTNYPYNNYNGGPVTYNNNPSPRIFSISPDTINKNSSSSVLVAITGDGFFPGSVVKLNGMDQAVNYINPTRLEMSLNNVSQMNLGSYTINVYNPNTSGSGMSNDATLKIGDGTVASTSSNKTVAKKSTSSTVASAKKSTSSSESVLAANALFGIDRSFFPSGLIQWILFLIFILLIIFLWRQIYNAPKYHAVPLKHH